MVFSITDSITNDVELRILDSTTEPKTSWYVNDDKNDDNFQNRGTLILQLTVSNVFYLLERNRSGRPLYRQVGKSVFFCYNPNDDETDDPPPLCKSDDDVKGPIDAFIIIYQSGLARKTSWEAQVEEAVYNETDEFWQQVYQYRPVARNFNWVVLLYKIVDLFNKILDL